jgi:type I restriction enzyme M protein
MTIATSNGTQQLVHTLWNYCNVLRDDGLSYGDYLEQLTYLLFLKLAHEQTQAPYSRQSSIPQEFTWPTLANKSGDDLEVHYRHVLDSLGHLPGMLGVIFRKAQNKIQNPARLEHLIKNLIGQERWSELSGDVKGDAYEGLLEKNAQDVKGGAGQYFTPRPLIDAIVDVIRPQPGETICDPASGTGGFILAASTYVTHNNPYLDRDQKRHLKLDALRGVEIVDGVTRLCAMNLFLHGVGPTSIDEGDPPVRTDDSLRADPGERFDVVLTNPPFGKKSSVLVVTEEGESERQALTIVRDDFWATTSNKQLNFVQHVKTLLKSTAAPRSSCPTMCCSKVAQAKRCDGSFCMNATFIPSSGYQPASSMPRVSKPTCCSSIACRPARRRGPNGCGSTTTARISTTR